MDFPDISSFPEIQGHGRWSYSSCALPFTIYNAPFQNDLRWYTDRALSVSGYRLPLRYCIHNGLVLCQPKGTDRR